MDLRVWGLARGPEVYPNSLKALPSVLGCLWLWQLRQKMELFPTCNTHCARKLGISFISEDKFGTNDSKIYYNECSKSKHIAE